MLITAAIENRQERIYVTRFASVISFFTRDETDPERAVLNLEPGMLAYPAAFDEAADHVRQAVLAFIADRLGIAIEQVLTISFEALKDICDPDLADHYRYARSKNRAYPRSFR